MTIFVNDFRDSKGLLIRKVAVVFTHKKKKILTCLECLCLNTEPLYSNITMKGKITKEKHSIDTNEKSEREAAEKRPPRG